jgi:uncharacterized protein DUF4287
MREAPRDDAKARYAGIGNEAVERATGRGWRAWIEALDREGAKTMTHKEIAAMLREEFRLAAWWAQMVTVGYEQANGARAPNQGPKGFRVHASRTIAADADAIFNAWNEAAVRESWLGAALELRSATPGSSARLAWKDAAPVVEVRLNAKGSRTQVVVEEEGLPDAAAVKQRKVFWREALDRLQASLEE